MIASVLGQAERKHCDEGNFSFPEESLLSGGVCEIFRYAQNDKTKKLKKHVTHNFFHTRIMRVRHARRPRHKT
mgnify:CR=1 FL=1